MSFHPLLYTLDLLEIWLKTDQHSIKAFPMDMAEEHILFFYFLFSSALDLSFTLVAQTVNTKAI